MKRIFGFSCTLVLAWSSASVFASGLMCKSGHCGPSCAPPPETCTVLQPVVQDKVCYHVDLTEEECKKHGKLVWKVTVKEGEKEVPCTRMVPVCVKDPCSCCTHTEFKEETVMKKVLTKTIDICPEKCGEDVTIKRCATIVVNHSPVTVMKELPVSCPSAPCCHK